MPSVRHALPADRDFWFSLDRHLPGDLFEQKILLRQAYVLTLDAPVGLLRYHLFWDSIPFCSLLYIQEGYRGRGFGRMLMDFWETEMREAGHDLLLTSTQSDEEAQHFYRALGYRDCGAFILPFPGYEQSAELILGRKIK